MASVTALIIFLGLVGTSSTFQHINKTVYAGSNSVLPGHQSHQKVSWYWYDKNNTPVTLCKGHQTPINRSGIFFKCNHNNITLLSITKHYSGTYYGTNFNIKQDTYYSVTVLDPTTPRTTTKPTTTKRHTKPKTTKKTTVKTTTRTTTTTEATTSTTLAATTHTHTELTLQTTNDLIALLQKGDNSTTSDEEIPKSMIGIIVAVVVCMLIIALCMVYYAFCYRKHRLNDKLEHLLSVEF